MHIRSYSIVAAAILAVGAIALSSRAFAQAAPESQQASATAAQPSAAAVSSAGDPQAASTPAAGVKTAALLAPTPPEIKRDQDATPALVAAPSAAATPAITVGQLLYNRTSDASVMDPLSWSVVIHKSRHELTLYYKGRLYQTYTAVFGRNLDNAAKAYEEDRRTPEGVYTIVKEFPSRRFHWFLRLNYPNFIDRERYHEMRADGVVPAEDDGWVPGVGGAIGIHGTDVPTLNEGLINWTTGCISLSNNSIDQLHRLLPVGTVVIIKP
jgi:lipoprotein-anchoring transpeptidase ErfK/SrfK